VKIIIVSASGYHNRLFGFSEDGIVFNDITVHNVRIDMRCKLVTGLDRFGDVVRYSYSLLMVAVLRGRAPPRGYQVIFTSSRGAEHLLLDHGDLEPGQRRLQADLRHRNLKMIGF
jgi:hypothetical protein